MVDGETHAGSRRPATSPPLRQIFSAKPTAGDHRHARAPIRWLLSADTATDLGRTVGDDGHRAVRPGRAPARTRSARRPRRHRSCPTRWCCQPRRPRTSRSRSRSRAFIQLTAARTPTPRCSRRSRRCWRTARRCRWPTGPRYIEQQTRHLRHPAHDDPDPAGAGHRHRRAGHRQHAGPVGAGAHPGAGPAAGHRPAAGADDADGHRRGGGDLGLRRAARRRRRRRPRRGRGARR